MEFTSPVGESAYATFAASGSDALVAFDFDGTLAPIVADPTRARIHPEAAAMLVALAGEVRAVAVITGRPVRQVLELGDLERVADEIASGGVVLHLFGQYGNERWDSTDRVVRRPPPPPGLADFARELTAVLRAADADGAYVEHKGLAVAVHTRRLSDAEEAYARLVPELRDLAARHGLGVEPGKHVIEARAVGMDKGLALDRLIDELGVGAVAFAGDDLGDVEAFRAVRERGRSGMPTLLVCSASAEQSALLPLSDVAVSGPGGVIELMRRLAGDIAGRAPEPPRP